MKPICHKNTAAQCNRIRPLNVTAAWPVFVLHCDASVCVCVCVCVCLCVCVACTAMLLSTVLNRGLAWPLPIAGFRGAAVCMRAPEGLAGEVLSSLMCGSDLKNNNKWS